MTAVEHGVPLAASRQRGFTLIEVVVALAILGTAGMMLFAWISQNLQTAVRLEQAPLRLRAAVLGHAVQRGGHAPVPHRLEEVQHPLAVQRGLRHERQDLLRPQLALHQRVPVEHGPHQREHVGGGVRVAREPESHHVAQLVDVVRGHHQHARRLVLQHALARGPLVGAQGMQGESLAQTVHGLKNARGGGYICAIGQGA